MSTPSPVTDGTFILRDNGVMWAHDARTGDVVWGPERDGQAPVYRDRGVGGKRSR